MVVHHKQESYTVFINCLLMDYYLQGQGHNEGLNTIIIMFMLYILD